MNDRESGPWERRHLARRTIAERARSRSPIALPILALALLGILAEPACKRAHKAEAAADPASVPTVAVAEVTRQDLARDFKIAAEFHPYRKSRSMPRCRATCSGSTWTSATASKPASCSRYSKFPS